MKINVQFTDSSETVIASTFSCVQDATAYPNQAQIDDSDPRYTAFVNLASTLAGAKSAQLRVLSAACAASIYAGFESTALGTAHTYPSQDTDQRNLLTAASVSIGAAPGWTTPLWCAVDTTWAYTPHTAAQVSQVNADWLAAKSARQSKYAGLVEKVNATTADTIAKVQAIVW